MKNRNIQFKVTSGLVFPLLLLACAAVVFVLTPTPAAAEAASGQFFPCFNYAGPPRQVGENVIVTFNITGSSTGTFTSTSTGVVGTEMDVVHRDGSITLHGTLLFTGSVNGGPEGTMLFTYEGIGNAVTGHETLRFVGRQGTGGLAGVHANLTAEGDVGTVSPGCDVSGAGTYTGHVIFAP